MMDREILMAAFFVGVAAGYGLCYLILTDDDSNVKKPTEGDGKEGGKC